VDQWNKRREEEGEENQSVLKKDGKNDFESEIFQDTKKGGVDPGAGIYADEFGHTIEQV